MNPSILQQFCPTELSVLHTLIPSCKATTAPLCLELPFPRGVLHMLHLQGIEKVLKVNRSYRQNLFTTVFSKGASLVAQTTKNQCGKCGFNPWIGKIPWEGNSYPLQYSGLENSMDRGAWLATVYGVAKSRTQLGNFYFHSPVRPTVFHLLFLLEPLGN